MKIDHLIPDIRSSSREIIRQLGFLAHCFPSIGSNSECHTIIELNLQGVMNASQLSSVLNLEKSTISKILGKLSRRGVVHIEPSKKDGRNKLISLTEKGTELVKQIHLESNFIVRQALYLLNEEEQLTVVRGMSVYAKALRHANLQKKYRFRKLIKNDVPQLIDLIMMVQEELQLDTHPLTLLAEDKIGSLYELYEKETSSYFVLVQSKKIIGGIGYQSLSSRKDKVCVVKDMYLSLLLRKTGLGRFILRKILQKIKADGFTHCYVETHQQMEAANALFKKFGFQPTENPLGTETSKDIGWYLKEL